VFGGNPYGLRIVLALFLTFSIGLFVYEVLEEMGSCSRTLNKMFCRIRFKYSGFFLKLMLKGMFETLLVDAGGLPVPLLSGRDCSSGAY
jgi:hypothetical protein